MNRVAFASALRAFMRNPAAFFKLIRGLPSFVRLFWRLFKDRRTPWMARCILIATLIYVISPVDLLPATVFNVIGVLDDLTVFLFGCQAFLRFIPVEVVDEHLAALDDPRHARQS